MLDAIMSDPFWQKVVGEIFCFFVVSLFLLTIAIATSKESDDLDDDDIEYVSRLKRFGGDQK